MVYQVNLPTAMKHFCKELIRGSMRPLRPLAECLEMLKGWLGGWLGGKVPIGSMGLQVNIWEMIYINNGKCRYIYYTWMLWG